MKKDIHPPYYKEAKVECSCGHTFTVGSTLPEIKVEICAACHPFYTGKEKLVDVLGTVERFRARAEKQKDIAAIRKGKKVKRQKRTIQKELKKSKV